MTITHHYAKSMGDAGYVVFAVDHDENPMELICLTRDKALANRVVAALDYFALDADQGDGK